MTAPRPFVWLGEVRWPSRSAYDVSCYEHGPVEDVDGQSLMTARRARQVRRQHLSDFHGRRWLWSTEDRWDWEGDL